MQVRNDGIGELPPREEVVQAPLHRRQLYSEAMALPSPNSLSLRFSQPFPQGIGIRFVANEAFLRFLQRNGEMTLNSSE
jgi:hypothetical protein